MSVMSCLPELMRFCAESFSSAVVFSQSKVSGNWLANSRSALNSSESKCALPFSQSTKASMLREMQV